MLSLTGPLVQDVLAAEKAVFALDECKTPVAHGLDGDAFRVPAPLPPGAMVNARVSREGGQVRGELLTNQKLAIRAELVADILPRIIDPDAF
jgi:hypothetical protein